MKQHIAATAFLAGLLLAACATSTGRGAAGDVMNGRKLFDGEAPIAEGRAPPCVTCHAVALGNDTGIGPNLSNIGNRAATTVAGMSAVEYLRASVVDGDAYLAGGFQEGIHYPGYEEALTPQELNDVVAYMLTLKTDQDN